MCSREVNLLIDPSRGCFLVEWGTLSCVLDVVVHVVETIASTFSGSVVRIPSGGEGLPKVCCRRVGNACRQFSSVCWAPIRSGHEESATRSSKWVFALSNGVWSDSRQAERMTSARFEVALRSAL